MDAKLIEKMDRLRCRYLLWATVGYAIFNGALLVQQMVPDRNVRLILALLQIPFVVLFFTGLLLLNQNRRKIASIPGMKQALGNELVGFYTLKSLKWGFLATLVSAVVIYMLPLFMTVFTVKTACLTIIYIGVLTTLIAQLIYLKR